MLNSLLLHGARLALSHELTLSLGKDRRFTLILSHSLECFHITVVGVDCLIHRLTDHLYDLELTVALGGGTGRFDRMSLTVMGRVLTLNVACNAQIGTTIHKSRNSRACWTDAGVSGRLAPLFLLSGFGWGLGINNS